MSDTKDTKARVTGKRHPSRKQPRTSWKEDIASLRSEILDVVAQNGCIYSQTLEHFRAHEHIKTAKCRRAFNVRLFVDEKEGRRQTFGEELDLLEAVGIVVYRTLKVDDFVIEMNFKCLYPIEFKTLGDAATSTISGHMRKQMVNKVQFPDFRYLGEFGKTRSTVIYQKQSKLLSKKGGKGFSNYRKAETGPSAAALQGSKCVFGKYARLPGAAASVAVKATQPPCIARADSDSVTVKESFAKLAEQGKEEDEEEESDSWMIGSDNWFDGHSLPRKSLLSSKRHRMMRDGMTVITTETFYHTVYELLAMVLDAYKMTDLLWDRFQMEKQPYFSIENFGADIEHESMQLVDQLEHIDSRESRAISKQDREQLRLSKEDAVFVSQLKQYSRLSVEHACALFRLYPSPYLWSSYLNTHKDHPQAVVTLLSDVMPEGGGRRLGPQMAVNIFNLHHGTTFEATASGKVKTAMYAAASSSSITQNAVQSEMPGVQHVERKRRRINDSPEPIFDDENDDSDAEMIDMTEKPAFNARIVNYSFSAPSAAKSIFMPVYKKMIEGGNKPVPIDIDEDETEGNALCIPATPSP